jgi:methionine-S-sulfoxide reductase
MNFTVPDGRKALFTLLKVTSLTFLAVILQSCSGNGSTESVTEVNSESGGCVVSFVDDTYNPKFRIKAEALREPHNEKGLPRAYIAMGCFWGSEGLMASAPGVLSTRVGFAGGTLEDPTYSGVGDHVETVEVIYDPLKTDYRTLLRHFWSHHNSRAKPIFRQYASAVFVTDQEQAEAAKDERKKWQEKTGDLRVLTAVRPLKRFYPAEENHQKYYLQQDTILLESLPGDGPTRLNTLLATKLNALSGRTGTRKDLSHALSELGIEAEASNLLFKRAVWPD